MSLVRYRGRSVPWGVFLDRYGRIVWMGPLPVEKNVFQRCEVKLRALLAAPSFQTMITRVLGGNEDALRTLGSIKTPESVSALFRIRAGNPPAKLKPQIDKTLRSLLPTGFTPADAKRWDDSKANYHYSFDDDRLIAK